MQQKGRQYNKGKRGRKNSERKGKRLPTFFRAVNYIVKL